jgi:endoglucanase
MQLYVDDFDRPGKHALKFPEVSEIFNNPRCHWFAPKDDRDTNSLTSSVTRLLARAHPYVPSCVLYNIPNRDCGQFSKGGAADEEIYIKWITAFSRGIQTVDDIIVVFEPDALALAVNNPWDQPPSKELNDRIALYNICLPILKNAGCKLYVDIGHPRWLQPWKAAQVLNLLDQTSFDGFSTNVSNFIPLAECIEWATEVSKLTNGKHFVIDTSRNGSLTHGDDWCNPKDKLLGAKPNLQTGNPLIDAYLWIKVPGESDGYCDNGPKAGTFWPEYAMMLLGKNVELKYVEDSSDDK